MANEIYIQSDSPIEQIWIRLSLYESTTLARELIEDRARKHGAAVGQELLKEKAIDLHIVSAMRATTWLRHRSSGRSEFS